MWLPYTISEVLSPSLPLLSFGDLSWEDEKENQMLFKWNKRDSGEDVATCKIYLQKKFS